MFQNIVRQFSKTLNNLDVILEKAAKHAEQRKFSPDAYLQMRIAPDMLPFTKQIQIACDSAKIAAQYISGIDAPKHPDDEKTFEDFRARIKSTLAYLDQCAKAETKNIDPKKKITLLFPAGKVMHLDDAIISRAIPNFFFHTTMAYALLREAGVELGKMDFLGTLNYVE